MRFRARLPLVAVALVAALFAGPAGAAPEPPVPQAAPAAAPAATPPLEASLANVQSVAVGYYHGCALLTNRQVRCWGWNQQGELGLGNNVDQYNRAKVMRNGTNTGPLTNVVQVVVGDYHTCVLLTNRQVRCTGLNDDGELGTGDNDDRNLPTPVRNAGDTGNLRNVIALSAETDGTCALLANRQVRCWGEDDYGQLGNGSPNEDSNLPVAVKGLNGTGLLTGVGSLAMGYDMSCAALTNGQARCWGYGSYGVLGHHSEDDSPHPVVVRNASDTGPMVKIARIATGGYHTCAILTNAQLRCFGYGLGGQLGNGDDSTSYRAVVPRLPNGNPLTGVRSIALTYDATCASLSNGQVRCWGDDAYGQLGDGTVGTPDHRVRPTLVRSTNGAGSLGNVTQVAGKNYTFCARQTTGQARCWGYGEYGTIGNGQAEIYVPRPRIVTI